MKKKKKVTTYDKVKRDLLRSIKKSTNHSKQLEDLVDECGGTIEEAERMWRRRESLDNLKLSIPLTFILLVLVPVLPTVGSFALVSMFLLIILSLAALISMTEIIDYLLSYIF